MPKLPRVTAKKLIAALHRLGFVIDRQRGSHAVLRHLDGRVTVVPVHIKDIPIGTLKGIMHDLSITVEELIASL